MIHVAEGARILSPHLSIFLDTDKIRVGAYSRLDGLIKIEGGLGVEIGQFVHISSFSHIGGGGGRVEFGDHSGCASGARIASGMPDLRYLRVSAAEPPEHIHVLKRRTVIGPYAIVFTGAIILPGRLIGEGAVVSAGAVVEDDVEAWAIVKGNPAVKVGERIVTKGQGLPAFAFQVAR